MEQGAEIYWVGEYVACYDMPTPEELARVDHELIDLFARSRPINRRNDDRAGDRPSAVSA